MPSPITYTIFATANDPRFGNTHRIGELRIRYSVLCDIFGSDGRVVDDKTDAEWGIIWSDGIVATIYNYKNGPAYAGRPIERVTEWSIGGRDEVAVGRVKRFITAHKKTPAVAPLPVQVEKCSVCGEESTEPCKTPMCVYEKKWACKECKKSYRYWKDQEGRIDAEINTCATCSKH